MQQAPEIKKLDLSGLTKEAISAELDKIEARLGSDWVYERKEIAKLPAHLPFATEPPTYPACVYEYAGEPSCLVGQVLSVVAPELYALVTSSEWLNRAPIHGVLRLWAEDASYDVSWSLSRLQYLQDRGGSLANCREGARL